MANNLEKNEINLKELILKTRNGLTYLFANKFKIIFFSVFGALIGLFYSIYYTKPYYSSKITFTIEQKGNSGGLGDLASMVGLGDISGGSNGMFGGENILFLMKSNRIIHEALKQPISGIEGGHLLNEYIKIHYAESLKEKKIKLFPKSLDTKQNNRSQDSLLQVITKQIREKQLVSDRIDKKTNIIFLEVKDENEQWAFLFSRMLINHAIDLYMELKVGKLMETENTLLRKKDSIRSLLDGSLTSLAVESDLNSHTPLMRHKTNQAKKQIDVQMLTALYGDIVKNLEITRFSKSQEEPIIEIIDEPIMPLEKTQFGKLKGLMIGGFLAGFLITLVLIVIKLLKGIMN